MSFHLISADFMGHGASRSNLLDGRGKGLPFFLAWSFGFFVVFTGFQVLWFIRFYSQSAPMILPMMFVWKVLLFSWHAILLFDSWWRRACWICIATAFGFEHPLTFDRFFAGPSVPAWNDPAYAAVLQMIVLMGARKRAWIWVVLIFAIKLLSPAFVEQASNIHIRTINELYRQILPGAIAIPMSVLMFSTSIGTIIDALVAFLVAFLMPPKVNETAEQKAANTLSPESEQSDTASAVL
jgi:hypothetical protein